jgi:hypothetical protein
MKPELRNEILSMIEKQINYAYPLRWADEKTTMGDFDGRELTIDVFFIPSFEQINFLSRIRPIRNRIHELSGSRSLFVFHSPEATKLHYSHLFPVTCGIKLVRGEIRFPIPAPGGAENGPEIIGSLEYDLREAA